MKLENEFLVNAPLESTWATLLDIERVARCLPGATLQQDAGDGSYRGEMQVKLGPMALAYKGTARMAEVEEDEHTATIEVKAKEARGQGTASARIHNHVESGDNGATRVHVQTDLNITGRPAQFGRGIMEDVAGKMLDDFAERLEREVVDGGQAPAASEVAATASSEAGDVSAQIPRPADATEPQEALDLGPVLYGPVAKRAATGLGILAVLFLLARLVRGRRGGLNVRISLR